MLGKCLESVKEKTPLVHNITNYVTVNDVANALLASGGSPIMSDEPDDVSYPLKRSPWAPPAFQGRRHPGPAAIHTEHGGVRCHQLSSSLSNDILQHASVPRNVQHPLT